MRPRERRATRFDERREGAAKLGSDIFSELWVKWTTRGVAACVRKEDTNVLRKTQVEQLLRPHENCVFCARRASGRGPPLILNRLAQSAAHVVRAREDARRVAQRGRRLLSAPVKLGSCALGLALAFGARFSLLAGAAFDLA